MLGEYSTLYDEILKHKEKWEVVREILRTKNNTIGPKAQALYPDTDDINSGFEVDSTRPLVSVIAKIRPFADWFIGVHDVNLCNKSGSWVPEKLIFLFPYDAGTARTDGFNNSVVYERKNIMLVKDPGTGDYQRGIGYLRFKFIRKFHGDTPVVIDEDNCPNIASLRKVV